MTPMINAPENCRILTNKEGIPEGAKYWSFSRKEWCDVLFSIGQTYDLRYNAIMAVRI